MRWPLACAVLLAGCVEGPVFLELRVAAVYCDPHHACSGGVALGADVGLVGARSTPSGPSMRKIDDLEIDQPELGEVARNGYEYTLHALATGTLRISAEIDGDDASMDLAIVPAHVGPIAVHGLPPGIPADTKSYAVYLGSEPPMVETALVDAAGDPVAGHGLEQWSPEDKLHAVPETYPGQPRFVDAALARTVSFGAEPVVVSNGADTLTFVGRPLGSAATLGLADAATGQAIAGTPILVGQATPRSFRVVPFTADALPLLGDAGRVSVSFSPPIATATALPGADKAAFAITATAPGATTMTVTFDGVTTTYPVTVQ